METHDSLDYSKKMKTWTHLNPVKLLFLKMWQLCHLFPWLTGDNKHPLLGGYSDFSIDFCQSCVLVKYEKCCSKLSLIILNMLFTFWKVIWIMINMVNSSNLIESMLLYISQWPSPGAEKKVTVKPELNTLNFHVCGFDLFIDIYV